jgi:hypothetical protein
MLRRLKKIGYGIAVWSLWSVEDLVTLWESYEQQRAENGQHMKFTYSDQLPEGKVFLTVQIAGHEVVCFGHFTPAGTPVQS